PSREEFEEIMEIYGSDAFEQTDITYTTDLKLYSPKGCDECSGTGYKGRLGIHELMDGSREIKRLIKKQASAEELFYQASSEGMTTLVQDGILKMFQGLTDLDEVRRVCLI
ncbi:MAG: type II/IV secretion system protein, partial [Thermodesulfobacteriota bacterium]